MTKTSKGGEAKKALGMNARAFVEQHFDLRNTAQEYEEPYQQEHK